jgi:hypothetical protein
LPLRPPGMAAIAIFIFQLPPFAAVQGAP